MGKTASESNQGDAQINIINELETHKISHDKAEIMIWIILICILFLSVTKIYEINKANAKKNAMKAAELVGALQRV